MVEPPQLHQRLVEASPDGLWLLDEHGRTVFANEGMARLLGRDRATLTGFSAFDALDADGHAQLREHLATMVSGHPGETNVESMLVRPDGSSIWTLVSWAPVRDGDEHLGWLHRVTEYTERKQLVATLQQREQQLATAQAIAQVGSWEWDVTTDTVTWSDQLYRITPSSRSSSRRRTRASSTSCTPTTGTGSRAGRVDLHGGRRVRLRRPDHPHRRRAALDPRPGPRRAGSRRTAGQDGRHVAGHHRPGPRRAARPGGDPAPRAAAADRHGRQPVHQPRARDRPGRGGPAPVHQVVGHRRLRGRGRRLAGPDVPGGRDAGGRARPCPGPSGPRVADGRDRGAAPHPRARARRHPRAWSATPSPVSWSCSPTTCRPPRPRAS